MDIKNIIRIALNLLHIDLTKNLEYDRLTKSIMKQILKPDSNCIDVGCHKGEILDIVLKVSPEGKHFGFEPIPYLYKDLKNRYNGKATILPYALSEKNGSSTFQHVKNAPAYSGIKKRKYNTNHPDIEEINVELKRLDDIIDSSIKIDLIKIDVEGAELTSFSSRSSMSHLMDSSVEQGWAYAFEPEKFATWEKLVHMQMFYLKVGAEYMYVNAIAHHI